MAELDDDRLLIGGGGRERERAADETCDKERPHF
jgi:hypothetical protein